MSHGNHETCFTSIIFMPTRRSIPFIHVMLVLMLWFMFRNSSELMIDWFLISGCWTVTFVLCYFDEVNERPFCVIDKWHGEFHFPPLFSSSGSLSWGEARSHNSMTLIASLFSSTQLERWMKQKIENYDPVRISVKSHVNRKYLND